MNQEFIDKQISLLYQQRIEKGAVAAFSRRFGISRHQVRRRALQLGVVQQTRKEPPWSEPELELLETHYHKNPENLRAIFRRRGYIRTATAISVKRKRLGLTIAGADIYSATGLAKVMGIDSNVITRWIDKGLLRATRKGTSRTPQQGGDSWQITHKAVRDFIADNVALVDIRKADKFWLVDLLVGKKG